MIKRESCAFENFRPMKTSRRLLTVFLMLQALIIVSAVFSQFSIAAILSAVSTAFGFVGLYVRIGELWI